ncbi:hypothetical protein MRX96_031737 [Rhipicephalus microplus]
MLIAEQELASLGIAAVDSFATSPYLTPVVFDKPLMQDWPTWQKEVDIALAEQRCRVLEAQLKLENIKATELQLKAKAQVGVAATRAVEVNNIAEDDLRSDKKNSV